VAKDPLSEATRLFGVRIRSRRQELGISQEKLAAVAGVHWTFVSQAERGLRNVNLHNLLKFAAGLDIDPGELIAGLRPPGEELPEPPPPPPPPPPKPPKPTKARSAKRRR
jgi:transcriptional regulator with XRE-family HTH domain